MDYIKVIPQISGEDCAKQAKYYDNTCADELYYELTGDYSILEDMTAVETVAAMAEEADIPLNVLAHVDFAEELEALLGFGASRIILKTSDVRTDSLSKAIQEIDGDYIYLYMEADSMESCLVRARQALEEEGFGGIVLAGDYKDPAYLQIADFLKVKTGAPVCLYVDTMEQKELSYVMKMTNGCGIILKNPAGQDIYALKKALTGEGLMLNIFEADFTFDDFKLNSDGMIPVVTQDYKTGEVLMVAYMNREAFEHTVETGKMTYYSRSRQELWCKGDTSGHYQYIKSLAIDCDNDTILAKVSQVGAACHTGNYSCFYRDLVHKKW